MNIDLRSAARRLLAPALGAALVSSACGSRRPEAPDAQAGLEAAAPDTVAFTASGDSFYVVIRADTTRLYRIRAGDTTYVSRGVATGRARVGDVSDGRRPAAAAVPIAVPEFVPDTAPERAGPAADTTPPVRRSAPGYLYHEDLLPVPSASDTVPFERLVDGEQRRFDPELTPEAWLARHPGDSLARFHRGSGEAWTRWRHRTREGAPCARALRRIPLPNRAPALRVVLFYPPPPREGLPATRDTLGLDMTHCRLGALWLFAKIDAPPTFRMTAADSAGVESRLDAVQTVLARRLEAPDRVGPPFLPSPAYYDWSWNRFWHADGTSHLLTYEDYSQDVAVAMWTESSGIPIRPTSAGRVPDRLDRYGLPELRRLAAGASLDTVLADSLLSLASRAQLVHEGQAEAEKAAASSELDSTLAATLAVWLEAADSLPSSRRAAALLLADRALRLGLPWMDASERARAAPFETLGARYRHTLGASYAYEGNWLEEAFAEAADDPVRDRAFLTLLRRAFGGLGCWHDEEGFRTVIERGEQFLIERPGSPLAPEVALEVARAHGDIVAIAWEIDDVVENYVDGEPLEDEAPSARRSAIEFYRLALGGLVDPALRREAWREAWRLAAGMPPVGAAHVYICD